jgi:hypothetical protein
MSGRATSIVQAIQAIASRLTTLEQTVAGFAESFTTKELTFTRPSGDELTLHTLCLDDVCVTKDQLKSILASAGAASTPPINSAQATSSPDTTPPVVTINGENPAHPFSPPSQEKDVDMSIRTQRLQELAKWRQWTGVGLMAAVGVASWACDVRVSSAKVLVRIQPPTERLFFVQTQGAPKSESILRKTIQDLQEGRPDFESMEPELQKVVKEQSGHTAEIYRHLGALQTLKYIGSKDGMDIYRALYQNAAVTYTIQLSPSGKVNVLLLQPAFPWE